MEQAELIPEQVIEKLFPSTGDENHIASYKVEKLTRWNQSTDRIILLSNLAIYVFKVDECRKGMNLADVKYMVKSKPSNEVLVYFMDENDLSLRF